MCNRTKTENNGGDVGVVKQKTIDSPKKGFEALSESTQFAALAAMMFTFFGAHNLLQEAIIKMDGFNYGVMLAYFEVVGVTICSYIERRFFRNESGRAAPLKAYPLLTFCLMSSSSLSNMSLNYINFPTKVVFRSCKLLPTMIIATIMNKKVYSLSEYVCAFCVCAGLVMFATADWKLTPSFNPIGLALVSLSVVADAILPNAQEKLFIEGASRLEVTVYTNFFTLIAMTIITASSGALINTLKMAFSNHQLALYMVVYTSISYIAVSSFMIIVKRFGAVTGVFLATTRKCMTLVLSFLFFPKAFSWYYVNGAVLVLGSIMIVSLRKQIMKKKKHANELDILSESEQSEKDELLPNGKDVESGEKSEKDVNIDK
jgi:adenosine 3'-phospho 5'-phosphosulfate transporter B3